MSGWFYYKKNNKDEDCCYADKKSNKKTNIEKPKPKQRAIVSGINIDFESPLLDNLLFPRSDSSGFTYDNKQPIIPSSWIHQEHPDFIQYITTSFENADNEKNENLDNESKSKSKSKFSLFPHQEFVRNY